MTMTSLFPYFYEVVTTGKIGPAFLEAAGFIVTGFPKLRSDLWKYPVVT